ncbi:hypothetical protein YPPY89_5055 [Yersinia pestis PY-89]|nr:hypothetical protein YPPY89_5055 [Yersinia pestis PY-89]
MRGVHRHISHCCSLPAQLIVPVLPNRHKAKRIITPRHWRPESDRIQQIASSKGYVFSWSNTWSCDVLTLRLVAKPFWNRQIAINYVPF